MELREEMQIKKHESPRKMGRNDKNKLAPAKLKALKKKTKLLVKKLKGN